MLELQNVSFSVDIDGEEKKIINDISLSIPDGKLIVVTGPNGSGKSSLAKLIAGIYVPTAGKIVFNGVEVTDMSITDRARLGIGFAFQQPVKFKGITVLDLLRIAAGKRISITEACEFLSSVGLRARDYINREVNSSLSGGELKRIEIATVIAGKASVSLFDEPEAGIDLWSFRNLIEVFRRMRERNKNGSIVIISHQERILDIADEIVVLRNGAIEKRGEKEKILPTLIGTSAAISDCKMGAMKEGSEE